MASQRNLVFRSSGQQHGAITRLISPGDLGQFLKPFVFLDYIEAENQGPEFGFHPHSGIATLTFPLTFDIEHTTSQGQIDHITQGGEEWMVSGSGIWHKTRSLNSQRTQGFQTWFALPSSHELSTPHAQFLQPEQVPRSGPITLLLGEYDGMSSLIDAPFDACYLWVQLKEGERWHYQPANTHNLAWCFAQAGKVNVSDEILERELGVFADGDETITFTAISDCAFLVGSAARLPQSLALGYYSVHSSPENLAIGEQRIKEIGATLQR